MNKTLCGDCPDRCIRWRPEWNLYEQYCPTTGTAAGDNDRECFSPVGLRALLRRQHDARLFADGSGRVWKSEEIPDAE